MTGRTHLTTLAGALASVLILAGCGGSEEPVYGECIKPAGYDSVAMGPVNPPARPVTYGTGSSWFVGPLQAAPADVSRAAGVQLYICP